MLHIFRAAGVIATAVTLGSGFGIAPTALAAPSKLMGMLPQGFSSSNCQVKTPQPPAVEKVSCDESTVSGGPKTAAFALFTNMADMDSTFEAVGDRYDPASACPGNRKSPAPWTYDSNGKTGGQMECGTMKSAKTGTTYAVLNWTDNAKLRVGVITGPDIASLFQWWQKNGG